MQHDLQQETKSTKNTKSTKRFLTNSRKIANRGVNQELAEIELILKRDSFKCIQSVNKSVKPFFRINSLQGDES